MKTFVYTAKDVKSANRTGVIEAPDEKQAAISLHQHGLVPVSIKVKSEGYSVSSLFKRFEKISHNELVNFTRQFSTMVTAGLSLPDSLAILQKQTRNNKFKNVLDSVLKDVEGGLSLASSLGKHPEVFTPIYIALVKAGETAGVLDKVLLRLADNLEKEREFRSKTKGALVYPAIIVFAMGAVMFIMMVFVIPKLTELYKEFDAELPLPTQIMMTMSALAVRFWWIVIAGVIALPFILRRIKASPLGRRKLDQIGLKIPVVGKLRQNVVMAEFTRTFGLLIGAGIPILEALKVVAGAVDNVVYREAIANAASSVERGLPLAVPLSQTSIFPPLLGQMVKTGEETGKLDEVLGKVSVYFEAEAEHAVKNLTTALEPMILILLAFGVAFLIIAVILPIYSLTSQF
ncbi:MAG TPA: type II secretion system F family protein [Patescibacteria group bacterium]